MIAHLEWLYISETLFHIKWVSIPSAFEKLEEGTMLCLQPFIKELAEKEVRTFIEVKGKYDVNLGGLEAIYGLATKPHNKDIPGEGINIEQHPECFLQKKNGKEMDHEHVPSAYRMLRLFLIESRFPGYPASKDLVFRVDTFKYGNQIFINEIEVWPIAMEFLDDLYQDEEKLKAFARVLASFVRNNLFTWPL